MSRPLFNNMDLGQEAPKATAGRMKLDHSTGNLLAFNASGTGSAAPHSPRRCPLRRHAVVEGVVGKFLSLCDNSSQKWPAHDLAVNYGEFATIQNPTPTGNLSVTNCHGLEKVDGEANIFKK